jgi:hypothetical protein
MGKGTGKRKPGKTWLPTVSRLPVYSLPAYAPPKMSHGQTEIKGSYGAKDPANISPIDPQKKERKCESFQPSVEVFSLNGFNFSQNCYPLNQGGERTSFYRMESRSSLCLYPLNHVPPSTKSTPRKIPAIRLPPLPRNLPRLRRLGHNSEVGRSGWEGILSES